MRVARAFSADDAAGIRARIWTALAAEGIYRDRPWTWAVERPSGLQGLKQDPIFGLVGSDVVCAAIDAILGTTSLYKPKNWGSLFIAFPSEAPWAIPNRGWHIDANYLSPVWPARGIKIFALLGDVAERGGGTLIVSGSHRLVHDWFRRNPPPKGARSAEMRRLLQGHPYIRELHGSGGTCQRVARFMHREECSDGIALRVIEMTGAAGDMLLLHPLLLHVAAANNSSRPRFLLSGGITTDMWGWGE